MTSREKRKQREERSYRLAPLFVLRRLKNEIVSHGRRGNDEGGEVSLNVLDTWTQVRGDKKKKTGHWGRH